MLLFWCSWFKYRFIKLELVTVGKFCFHFSHVLGSVVDCVNINPSARARLNYVLRDAQNVCALTKVGTVLKCPNYFCLGSKATLVGGECSHHCVIPAPLHKSSSSY